jgi:hAT family C-terminal dimerisation region
LSETLQLATKEYSAAMRHVRAAIRELNETREALNSEDPKFDQWWNETDTLLEGLDVVLAGLNGTSDNSKAAYRQQIVIPIYDSVLQALQTRFNMRSPILERLGDLLPLAMHQKRLLAREFEEVVRFYPDDVQDFAAFEDQYLEWKGFWTRAPETLPSGIVETLAQTPKHVKQRLSIITSLLHIYAVVPVSTATNERTFSSLKYLKNRLRSTMTQNRLNALTLIYDASDRAIDAGDIARQLLRNSRRSFKEDDNTVNRFIEDECEEIEIVADVSQDDSGIFDDDFDAEDFM